MDPTAIVEVFVRVTGGEVGAASSLAPKLGPLGLSPKKIGEDIAKETTKDWKGLRVTVKLTPADRQAKIAVVPSAAALVIKGAQGARAAKPQEGAATSSTAGASRIDDVIEVARVMRPAQHGASELQGTVKEILGTCVSVGCHSGRARAPRTCKRPLTRGRWRCLPSDCLIGLPSVFSPLPIHHCTFSFLQA